MLPIYQNRYEERENRKENEFRTKQLYLLPLRFS